MTEMVIPFCKCENWYKFFLYQFFLNNVFLRNKATIYCGQSGTPGGNRTHNGPLGEQIIALCMVRLVRWDVPNSLIYRGFCRMTLSCRDAQYHVFHSFSQRPISKILAKAKSRLSKNVPRWVSLCKLIITNPTLKNQGSDLFIG